ncbi:type III secretion system chaperone [Vibrio parahaemolyticus]|nr:type III secretion system chaperone [Vibrio parahaemolyticus]EJC6781492.1 type III secretion system chaperone [Vibrio parahaemolyticus]EJC6812298.1 type III secretion system chaperone [Vibrio parahaemolyticus]EJC6926646.1 type III secretion system chaperone [Vibrio parahaemolyticus]EJC6941099.1 type III secretion system chaperone [Vibrio parahaemolyticus]
METGKINILLAELGDSLNLECVTEFEHQMWSLCFSEDNAIDVQFVQEKNEVLVSKSLVVEKDILTADKLQVLLEYNFLYRETGGVQFCINPTTKDILLQIAITADTEISQLANVISQLNELSDTWVQLFQNNTVVDFSQQTGSHPFIQV